MWESSRALPDDWRTRRRAVASFYGYHCAVCGAESYTGDADHIDPDASDERLHRMSNLRWLCVTCHAARTQAQAAIGAQRARGLIALPPCRQCGARMPYRGGRGARPKDCGPDCARAFERSRKAAERRAAEDIDVYSLAVQEGAEHLPREAGETVADYAYRIRTSTPATIWQTAELAHAAAHAIKAATRVESYGEYIPNPRPSKRRHGAIRLPVRINFNVRLPVKVNFNVRRPPHAM